MPLAAAWAATRDAELAKQMEQVMREGTWSDQIKMHNTLIDGRNADRYFELWDALRSGKILAYGDPGTGRMECIPAVEWSRLKVVTSGVGGATTRRCGGSTR
jgi:hypothetical protein